MAFLKQALEPDKIKSLKVSQVKEKYNELAKDYNHLLDFDYIYCPFCGEWRSARQSFYHSKKTKTGYNHYACKQCILEQATDLVDKKTNERKDNREKTIEVFKMLDLPFIDDVYQSQLNLTAEEGSRRGTAFSQMIVLVSSLPQYAKKTFRDSVFAIDDLENNTEEQKKIVLKTVRAAKKRFGSGYSDEDYMTLEDEYQDWITRYECNTKAQEEVFENLALIKLLKKRALLDGRPTKDLDKQQQDWLDAGNLKPKQNSSNAFNETLTFGQMIEKWEEERPIPEPEGEFKDIDKIGLYLDTFFKGHLSKMMGLKNGFSSLYDKFMSKYIVTKPQYDEDTDSEELFNQIFGSKVDEE